MSMLARAARPSLARVVPAAGAAPAAARNMATLREIELRLKSVKNIEKITKSMKMIASTKLARAQRAMVAAKSYGIANMSIYEHSESEKTESEGKTKKLFIVVSSDRGLCGGIHSSVSKATRREVAKDLTDSKIVVLGDKSKAQLQRQLPGELALTFNQIGKDIPTFADGAVIADKIVKSGIEYDSVSLVYNKFVSAISYESHIVEVFSEEALKKSPGFRVYEMEDDVTRDLSEFALANAIYAALVEGHAAEQSSRRNAMDNATKNAGEMITSLTMQYNRGRQAVITNELIDIITGASGMQLARILLSENAY
ncbi:ATP synthase F1 gamma [Calocera viscosa TUFC12733]|uniref:ATP synthase subunit gamma n=1 Tax=Calocera viscosa (strain TUFC12733) TaxID=1330018 RepID=A0A167PUF6_CALVF|nr:ATP synthase F1 gamma [Calocera viscosa TUFC12733]